MLKALFRAPAQLYRWGCGPLLGRRFLLLRHTGRRTGLRRETVLEVMQYRPADCEAVVMCAFGPTADWLQNLRADPHPEVIIGRRRFVADYRILDAAEAVAVVRGYEQRHRMIAPVMRAVLGRLLGRPYRGSNEDRWYLVKRLPLVALRPRPESPWR
jgi:deazaflavin-dependent oxidoreductase (nitroreductase family)